MGSWRLICVCHVQVKLPTPSAIVSAPNVDILEEKMYSDICISDEFRTVQKINIEIDGSVRVMKMYDMDEMECLKLNSGKMYRNFHNPLYIGQEGVILVINKNNSNNDIIYNNYIQQYNI